MTQKDPRPEGIGWASPYLIVKDVDAAVKFYKDVFAFEVRDVAAGEDGVAVHAELKYKDQMIMLGKQGAYGGQTKTPAESGVDSPINMYLYTEDVDQFCKHAANANATVTQQPDNMFWGDRMCTIKDPDGYNWCFATHVTEPAVA